MGENKFDFKSYIDNIILQNEEYIDVDHVIDYMDVFNYDLSKRNQLLKRIYSYNLQLTKKLASEISDLSQIETSTNGNIADIKLITPPTDHIQKQAFKESVKEEVDISNYIKIIDNYNVNNDYTYLIKMIDKANFLNTMNHLIAYYTLEYITLKRLKKEDRNSKTILEEEMRITNILNNLYNCRDSQTKVNYKEQNKLIYLTKSTGNINFLDSLDYIPNEQYQDVYNALLSILNGTFKDSKQLSKVGSDCYEPLTRVRVSSIRIYYLQIIQGLYLIADVQVKKMVNSNRYSEYIHRISKDASIEKNNFLNLDKGEQDRIIKDHELITQDIISKLISKKKVLK